MSGLEQRNHVFAVAKTDELVPRQIFVTDKNLVEGEIPVSQNKNTGPSGLVFLVYVVAKDSKAGVHLGRTRRGREQSEYALTCDRVLYRPQNKNTGPTSSYPL